VGYARARPETTEAGGNDGQSTGRKRAVKGCATDDGVRHAQAVIGSESRRDSSCAAARMGGRAAAAPPPGPPSAERSFQEGLDAQKKKDWRKAAQAYEAAIKQREAFPEAWNGLGYSLRQQGKYPEAIKAYDRALKLRPDYAEALEYLGEAYVKMGKLDDARAVLGRLEPLDKKEAAELRTAIDKAKK
jgi:tetratricopeptide (TPR) repeat protein